jgi:hypothetical protein
MALVGITVLDEVEQLRPPLVSTFEKVLAAMRPDLPIRRAVETREALGLPAYRKLLFAYQETGKLEPEQIAEIGKGIGSRTRYAILARVEKNSVRASGVAPSPSSTTSGPPTSMPSPPTLSRDARIRFTIYDLGQAREVFQATYISSSDNRTADPAYAPFEKGPPKIDPNTSTGRVVTRESIPDQSPESPSLAEALIEGYRAFALDLPAVRAGARADSTTAR